MIYWTWNKCLKKYPFVSWFKILSQYDLSIAFLLGFGMAMQYPSKVQRYVIDPKGFLGYPTRGIACALNIPTHKYYPSDILDQNNLAHGVYWIPQIGYCFPCRFW